MSFTFDPELIEALVADAKDVWPEDFVEIEEMFNRCCLSIAVDVIRRLELFESTGDSETLESIREKVSFFKDGSYVFGKVLAILCEEGVLELKDGTYTCLDNEPDVETPAECLVSATRAFPGEGASFQWLARAHDGLVRFITGKLFSEEVMFPWGSFKLVEEVYNTSDVYGFYSRLAGRTIQRIVETQFNAPVTLLEVGAGTGNGTMNVLSQIDTGFERYIFTDVSKALMQLGRRRIKKLKHAFMEYRVLDISKDLTEQDVQAECADIVLAVNAIHATDEVVPALEISRRLLKPGGWFILSELSPPANSIYRYMELTFGLLPSYANYTDREMRPVAPIIRPDEWSAALKKAGFVAVETIPGDRLEGVDRGGIVIGIK